MNGVATRDKNSNLKLSIECKILLSKTICSGIYLFLVGLKLDDLLVAADQLVDIGSQRGGGYESAAT